MVDPIVDYIRIKMIRKGKLKSEEAAVWLRKCTIVVELILELLITLIVGLLLHKVGDFLLVFILYTPLRRWCGKYHAVDTCSLVVLWGLMMCLISLAADLMVQFHAINQVYWGLNILEGLWINCLTPVNNPIGKKNMDNKKTYKKYARRMLFAEAVLGNVGLLLGFRRIYAIIVMKYIILIVVLLLGVAKNALVERDRREAEFLGW